MNVVGVDPGLSGGLAVLSERGEFIAVHDLPVITDHALAWIDGDQLRTLLLEAGPARVIIERVSAMPRQGVSSSFKFGCSFGSILGVVQALQMPLELVAPSKWKRELGLIADKNASLHRARLLFPQAELQLARHADRAESLLIAYWFVHRASFTRAAAAATG